METTRATHQDRYGTSLERAMAWALSELRIVLEPSGAAALAAALKEGRGRVGVVCTGGNVDPELLVQITARVASER